MRTEYWTNGCIGWCHRESKHVWRIMELIVPRHLRGRGHGRELLQRITKDADRGKITLKLQVGSTRSKNSLSNFQLTLWYQRYGFIKLRQREMIRLPIKTAK